MKFNILMFLMLIFSFGCGQREAVSKPETKEVQKPVEVVSEKKEVPKPTESVEVIVEKINKEIFNIPVLGFGYRSEKIQEKAISEWKKTAIPLIKKTIEIMPEGYVLEIAGHATPPDPKSKILPKIPTIVISENRAKWVYNLIKQEGIDVSKVVVIGKGESEPVNPSDPFDPKNRRVTFKVRRR